MKRQYASASDLQVGNVFVGGVDLLYTAKTVEHVEPIEGDHRVKVTTIDGPTFYFRESKEIEVLA